MRSTKAVKFLNKMIELGVIFLIVFSPLAFGSVHVWAYSIMELSVILLISIWLIKMWLEKPSLRNQNQVKKMPKGINLLVMAFVGLLLFQLIPFSSTVLKYLSPATYDLYRMTLTGYDRIPVNDQGLEHKPISPHSPSQQASIISTSNWRSISIYPYATRTELLKVLSYIGLFYLVVNNLNDRKQVSWLIAIIILIGCFEAFYGLLEYLSGHQHIFLYKKKYCTAYATGTFVNKNHFAGYLEMVIPLGVGVMIYHWLSLPASPLKGVRGFITRLASEQGSKLALLALAVIIMLLGVIFSQSRMGILSVVTSLLVMTALLIWGGGGKGVFKLISIILIIGTLGGMWLGIEPLIKRFSLLPEEITPEISRVVLWEDTIQLVRDFPLWGSGLGTYRYIFPKYKSTKIQATYYHAHNDYLELLAETGMIGFLTVMGLVGYLLVQVTIKWRRRKNPYVKGMVLGGIGSLVAQLFHSLADFNMHIPANVLLVSVIIGTSWKMVTQL
jgi:O-antigen ligase